MDLEVRHERAPVAPVFERFSRFEQDFKEIGKRVNEFFSTINREFPHMSFLFQPEPQAALPRITEEAEPAKRKSKQRKQLKEKAKVKVEAGGKLSADGKRFYSAAARKAMADANIRRAKAKKAASQK